MNKILISILYLLLSFFHLKYQCHYHVFVQNQCVPLFKQKNNINKLNKIKKALKIIQIQ